MDSKTQTGYLVVADISGYTGFLAQTELEHAHLALSYLLEAIVGKMRAALTIVKLEGDAVLAYADESQLPDGQSLLGLIDQTYLAFRDQADTLHQRTTCPCKACQALPSLDLKFLVHHGEFILQHVAGIQDLVGSDVNLVHRLMKNRVASATGWRGYALFTRPGLECTQVDKQAFVQQRESYEHFGDVETYVMDLHVRYKSLKAS
jgi:class 3 adenylate cyclase